MTQNRPVTSHGQGIETEIVAAHFVSQVSQIIPTRSEIASFSENRQPTTRIRTVTVAR
jgi:hypothetical protein